MSGSLYISERQHIEFYCLWVMFIQRSSAVASENLSDLEDMLVLDALKHSHPNDVTITTMNVILIIDCKYVSGLNN